MICAGCDTELAEGEQHRQWDCIEALRGRVEHLLHGICDALDEGKPTYPILRALLKGTEHEGHRPIRWTKGTTDVAPEHQEGEEG